MKKEDIEFPIKIQTEHIAIVLDVCPVLLLHISVSCNAVSTRPARRSERIQTSDTGGKILVQIISQLGITVFLSIVLVITIETDRTGIGSCYQ